VLARPGLEGITIEGRGVFLPRFPVASAQGNDAPGLVAGWVNLAIGQATHVAGANNTISITLASDAPLVQEEINITLSLPNLSPGRSSVISEASTEDGFFALSETPSFGQWAAWNEYDSVFLFKMVGGMEMGRSYTIDILIENPLTGRDGFTNFVIEASSFGRVLLPPTVVPLAPENGVPFLVADFTSMSIAQSNFAANGYNTFTVLLTPRALLDGQYLSKITISGLTGSATRGYDDVLPLSRRSHRTLGGYGRWFQVEGKLVLTVSREDLEAHEELLVRFDLKNGPDFQDARNVSVHVRYLDWDVGYVPLTSWQRMENAPGIFGPLLIGDVMSGYIEQSTTVAHEDNPLLLELSTSVDIPAEFTLRIIVSGLYGVATSDLNLPVAVGIIRTNQSTVHASSMQRVGGGICGANASTSREVEDPFYNTGCADLDQVLHESVLWERNITGYSELNGSACIEGALWNATWNRAEGTLVIPVMMELSKHQVYSMFFTIQNGPVPQPAQDISLSLSVETAYTSPFLLDAPKNNSAPLKIIGWMVRNVMQATSVFGASNAITVSLAFTGQLYGGTLIRISGFENAQDAGGCKPLVFPSHENQGEASRVFHGVANWSSSGEIIIGVQNRSLDEMIFVLQFNLTNPLLGQSSTGIFVETQGKPALPSTQMLWVGTTSPFSTAGFDNTHIEQSSASQSTRNTISVAFSLFAPLLSSVPSLVYIQGLRGSNTSSGTLALHPRMNQNLFASVFGLEGEWIREGGTLVLAVVSDAPIGEVFSFSFDLMNPDSGRGSNEVSIYSTERGSASSARYTMAMGSGNAAPLLVADFLEKGIGQSTASQGAPNTLTVSLSTRASLLSGSVVTISGLVGSATPNSTNLLISVMRAPSMEAAAHFGSASWVRESGILRLTVVGDTVPNATYGIAVTLQNPVTPQSAASNIKISASGVTIGSSPMDVAQDNAAPFEVVGLTAATLSQEPALATGYAPSPAGLLERENTLTLEFETSAALVAGSTVVIDGLTGSPSPSVSNLALTCNPPDLDSQAQWAQGSGTVSMNVTSDTLPDTLYTCSFALLHPTAVQTHPNVTFRTEGTRILPTLVRPTDGNRSAFTLSRVYCAEYPSLQNGLALPGSPVQSPGSVRIWCDTGHSLTVGGERAPFADATCLSNGTWSLLAKCTPDDGTLLAWGRDSHGQLGGGTAANQTAANTTAVIGLSSGIILGVGGAETSYALHRNGSVFSWGANDVGQLGLGTNKSAAYNSPELVSGLGQAVRGVAAGSRHAVVKLADDSVSCWGDGTSGQLGNGLTASAPAPVNVVFPNNAFIRFVAAAGNHSLAIGVNSDVVYAWGANDVGQLGIGSTQFQSAPILVGNDTNLGIGGTVGMVVSVAAGETFSLALLSSGAVMEWGSIGGNAALLPTQVTLPASNKAVAIAAGNSMHALVLLEDGTVMAWGQNDGGQLGDGTLVTRSQPVTVNGLGGQVSSMALGREHSLVASTYGPAEAWGANSFGQIGSRGQTLEAETVLKSALSVGAGRYHSLAVVKSD